MLNLRTIITLLIPSSLLGFSFLWWKRKQNRSVNNGTSDDKCSKAEAEFKDSAIEANVQDTLSEQDVREISESKLTEITLEYEKISATAENDESCENSFTRNKVEEETLLAINDQTECYNCFDELDIDDLNPSLPPSPTKSSVDSTCSTRFRHLSSCDCDSAYVEDYSSDNVSVNSSDTALKSPGSCTHGEVLDESQKNDENLSVSLENCRNWYGPALESVIQEESFDWGNTPLSDTDCISEMFTDISFEQVNTHSGQAKRKREDLKKTPKKVHKESKSKKKGTGERKKESKESSPPASSKSSSTPKNSKSSPRKRHDRKRKEESPRKGIENCWRDSCETEYDNTITTTLDYTIPDECCGRLIGRNGKHVNEIKQKTGAIVCIEPELRDKKRVVSITGTLNQIKKSEKILNARFDNILDQVQELDIDVAIANIRESSLPLNSTVDCIVTAIVGDNRFFIQIFCEEVDKNIVNLQQSLGECYLSPRKKYVYIDTTPQVGDVCVGYIDFTWCRLKVVEVLPGNEVSVSFLDYGGIVNVPAEVLLKIRPDFLKLPMQAIECCLWRQNGQQYDYGTSEMLGLFVEGKALQAKLKSRDDGVSSVDLSFVDIDTQQVVSVNEELAYSNVYSTVQ